MKTKNLIVAGELFKNNFHKTKTKMKPKKPFYVSFIHDRIPFQVDHSKLNPGPNNSSASRAGYTSIKSKPRLKIQWENIYASNGKPIAIYLKSVVIFFHLYDFLIAVSSGYPKESCPYKVTLRHELDAHIYDPIRIFHSYRNILIKRLNAISVPTKSIPLSINIQASKKEIKAKEEKIDKLIFNIVLKTKKEIAIKLIRARNHHDSNVSYISGLSSMYE